MNIAWYKVKTLIIKDLKNLIRNLNVSFMLLLPIGFALLYKNIMPSTEAFNPSVFVFELCILLNVGLIPISVVAMSIAEEKEKHTLRTLILSNVSASEFLIDKVFVGYLLFIIDSILIFFICGMEITSLPWYFIVFSISAISALLFGAIVGLLSKDQMTTGYYSTPVMLLFMAPIFGMMNETLDKVTNILPTKSMLQLFTVKNFQDLLTQDSLFSLGVILVWIILSIIIFRIIYKKNRFDN